MKSYKIEFEILPWENPMPGVRFKALRDGEKLVRLVEFSSEFVEPHWCEKGHIGFVLQGELEIDFHGTMVRYPEGSGINIPQSGKHGHKAHCITSKVLLFLVENE